jgi:hypothetical protein
VIVVGRREMPDVDDRSAIERTGHLVELVEPIVLVQPERIALHLEIPAIQQRLAADFVVRGALARAVGIVERFGTRAMACSSSMRDSSIRLMRRSADARSSVSSRVRRSNRSATFPEFRWSTVLSLPDSRPPLPPGWVESLTSEVV